METTKEKRAMCNLWPVFFVSGCCGTAFILSAVKAGLNNLTGIEPVYSPKQANLLVISGVVNKSNMDLITEWYDNMDSPKWIITIGSCTFAKGIVSEETDGVCDISKYLNVDVTIPGCPPTESEIVSGLERLKDIMLGHRYGGVNEQSM